jgi:ABC-type dipeptide/oligopeptide/nickel transport system permease component
MASPIRAGVFSVIGTSFPTFVFGLLVLMIFYANLMVPCRPPRLGEPGHPIQPVAHATRIC